MHMDKLVMDIMHKQCIIATVLNPTLLTATLLLLLLYCFNLFYFI